MERLYCGDKQVLPQGYTGFATRYTCLRKGVGIGLYKIRDKNGNGSTRIPQRAARPWYQIMPWWVWGLIITTGLLTIIFLVLFIIK